MENRYKAKASGLRAQGLRHHVLLVFQPGLVQQSQRRLGTFTGSGRSVHDQRVLRRKGSLMAGMISRTGKSMVNELKGKACVFMLHSSLQVYGITRLQFTGNQVPSGHTAASIRHLITPCVTFLLIPGNNPLLRD